MTPEQLDEARAKEALRRLVDSGQVYCHEDIAALGARLAREGWTPPEPVDPDVLAFREWFADLWDADEEILPGRSAKSVILEGASDNTEQAAAYLAGARMAREQERERAKEVVDRLSDLVERVTYDGKRVDVTNVNAGEMISARKALAKYRGEA